MSSEIARPAQAAAELFTAHGPSLSVTIRSISEPALFVLTRAVSGVISAVVREGSPHFGTLRSRMNWSTSRAGSFAARIVKAARRLLRRG